MKGKKGKRMEKAHSQIGYPKPVCFLLFLDQGFLKKGHSLWINPEGME
ncbi:MAG TPA: hypothetical protein VM123_04925 [archaeon]|nr:hypothetical protein [archaeon]